jgi:transcription initiation factor TFIIH subunit 4
LRLSLSISIAGAPNPDNEENQEQFIVVETNYRIYAYTSSDLHYAIINLFSEVMYRFPFMVVAQMSRDSVQQAAGVGIQAKQILHYLRTSSHPTCRKNLHWVPQVSFY